jgi:polar amino acid transport system substrate-binding protein
MKKILMPLIAALVLPLLARAESACPSLVITGHPANPPVTWASAGTIVGAGPELVASIARQLGVGNVVSKDFGSWENAQRAARKGQADVISGLYKNDERTRYLNYIDPPFMADPVVVVVRKGEGFSFKKWEDLKARRGVMNAGESRGDRFDAFMKKELTVFREQGVERAFEALLNIEADYLITGLYQGKNEARRLGISAKVEFLPIELETADVYVAFSKKSKCYQALSSGFAARLKAAVEQGTVRQFLDSAEKQLEK